MGGHCTATMKFVRGEDEDSCKSLGNFLWQGVTFFELFVLYDAALFVFSLFAKLGKLWLSFKNFCGVFRLRRKVSGVFNSCIHTPCQVAKPQTSLHWCIPVGDLTAKAVAVTLLTVTGH